MVVLATTWLLLPDKLTRLREGGDKILWSRLLLPMSPSMDEASLEEFVMAPFPVGTVNTAEKRESGIYSGRWSNTVCMVYIYVNLHPV